MSMLNIPQKPRFRFTRCLLWTVMGRGRTHSPATPSPTTSQSPAVARPSSTGMVMVESFTPTNKHTSSTSRWHPKASWDDASRRPLECRSERGCLPQLLLCLYLFSEVSRPTMEGHWARLDIPALVFLYFCLSLYAFASIFVSMSQLYLSPTLYFYL